MIICETCDYSGRPPYKSPCSECVLGPRTTMCRYEHKENQKNADIIPNDSNGFSCKITEEKPKDRLIGLQILKKLFYSFPNGLINYNFEFIADSNHKVNSFFSLDDCETEEDVSAKILEWFSREAYKSKHFNSDIRNSQVHEYHLNGINAFCDTSFNEDDMEVIYTHIGNRVNHKKTLEFIRSGYSLDVLTKGD